MPKARTGASQTPSSAQHQLEFLSAPQMQQDGTFAVQMSEDLPDVTGEFDDDTAPTFALVRESGIDGEKRCLYLVVESTKGEQFRLDFTPGCIPLAVAALSSELGYLRQHQPDQNDAVQPITVESFQLGETANGSPALLAGMEGGGELPLQLSLQELQKLNKRISEYIRSKAVAQPFS
ncbi:MAG TPA: hypothetical protein VIG90_19355 [Pedomonas sp.]|uniref:hypothetical protein n=1 Tax=Pedomonas sp. TaxID=2976421 RepID=UPI002F42B0F3